MTAAEYPSILIPRGGVLSAGEEGRVARTAGAGGVIVFPTETFYALGADPFSPAALGKVYRLKGRPASQPLLVLIDGPEGVARFAAALPPPCEALMDRFWPGALTLLLPAVKGLQKEVVSAANEVALRVPGSRLSRSVVAAAGGALTGTSANSSGEPPASDARRAAGILGPGVDLVVDGGTLPPSKVSTILSCLGGRTEILREGAVGREELAEFLSD